MPEAWILERTIPMSFFQTQNEDGDAEIIFKKTEVWRNIDNGTTEVKNIFFSKIYSPDGFLVDEKNYSVNFIRRLAEMAEIL